MPSPIRNVWDWILGLGLPLDILASFFVASGWLLVICLKTGDPETILPGILTMLGPLLLIWFREPISGFVGSFGFHQIDGEAPPGLVAFFGWLGLVGVIWLSAQETFQNL